MKLGDDTNFLPAELRSEAQTLAGSQLWLRLDQLDSLRFPRSGYAADLRLFRSMPSWGADQDYSRVTLNAQGALSHERHTLQAAVQGAVAGGNDDLPFYELSSLGGFLRLSGYRTGEFLGQGFRFARLIYNYRVTGPGFLEGVYVGVSTEAGRIDNVVSGLTAPRTLHGNAVYLAADTPLGPVYFAYGRASSANQAFYLFLGLP